jgi:hypothetical protein
MWGTSFPGDKLTGDFGNEPDARSISDPCLFRLLAGICHPALLDFCNKICHKRTSDAADGAGGVHAVDEHPAAGRLEQSGNDVEDGALAATGRADQADKAPRRNRKRNRRQRRKRDPSGNSTIRARLCSAPSRGLLAQAR